MKKKSIQELFPGIMVLDKEPVEVQNMKCISHITVVKSFGKF